MPDPEPRDERGFHKREDVKARLLEINIPNYASAIVTTNEIVASLSTL
jgi:hypothetical protein